MINKVTCAGNLKYLFGNVTFLPQMLFLVGVHDFDQNKACFVPGRVPLQLVQLVLRAGLYVGIYCTGALVQYLSNAEMHYPKSIQIKQ